MKPISVAAFALVLSTVCAAAASSAGTVVTSSGDIVQGEIVEVVNGHHVTMKVGDALRTFAWAEVFTLKFDAAPAGAPAISAAASAPAPYSPAAYAPTPYAAAPAIIAAPAPWDRSSPPTSDSATPSLATKAEGFSPRVSVTGRFGYLAGSWNHYRPQGLISRSMRGEGVSPQVDLGLHLSPSWTLFGSYQYASLGSAGLVGGDWASHAVGVGLKAVTNPRGRFGFYSEMGAGYRWLKSHTSEYKMIASGLEPLRVGLGISVHGGPRVRFDLVATVAVGQLTKLDQAAECPTWAGDCSTIPDARREWHVFRGLSLAGTFDL